jgi:hypothetical protein
LQHGRWRENTLPRIRFAWDEDRGQRTEGRRQRTEGRKQKC